MKRIITLGFFDGVHRGHMKILKRAAGAKRKGQKSTAITFNIPPEIKGHHFGLLTPPEEKKRLLRSAGIDRVEVISLTGKIRKMTAESFFDKILRRKYAAGRIIVGSDFRFGRNRSGNAAMLSTLCAKSGINFESVPVLRTGVGKISSSSIRNLIIKGGVKQANRLLGRKYTFSGVVVRGRGAGSSLGFPTANINAEKNKLLPRGVFAGSARIGVKVYSALANIGTRPTFTKSSKVVPEVYINNFSGNLLGKRIAFSFSRKIRDERKYRSTSELREQISRDIKNNLIPIRR